MKIKKQIQDRIKILENKLEPLKKEYNFEYKLWFKSGSDNKTEARKKLLEEYENGAKGNMLFSLNERIIELKDLLDILTF